VHVITSQLRLARPLPLIPGGMLEEVEIAYRVHGAADAPVILVLGGISAGRHVTSCADDPAPGWWERTVGDGRAIDTARFRVLTLDYVCGRGKSAAVGSGAKSLSMDTRDQANVIAELIEGLGIGELHATVGASYGGMVALAFAAEHPQLVGRVVVFGAAHESHPMATAWRAIQRNIVRLAVAGGRDRDGLRIARALAMTTYRSAAEFAKRFELTPRRDEDGFRFPVEDYLHHQGTRFADAFTADRFLCLSESCDLHRVAPAEILAPTTLIAVDSDTLVPPWQMKELAGALPNCRTLHEISSDYGHDAFLKEESVARAIGDALQIEDSSGS